MIYLYTCFDRNRDSRPLACVMVEVADGSVVSLDHYNLYIRNSGRTYYDIWESISSVRDKLNLSDKIVINDFKQSAIAYGLIYDASKDIYDYNCQCDKLIDVNNSKSICVDGVKELASFGFNSWAKLRAEASSVYRYLQESGVIYGYQKHHPIWSLDTFSGRSKTSGINIQGFEAGTSFCLADNTFDTYINFDWIAADLRMAAILSNDKKLDGSFANSDPYQFMCDNLHIDGMTRDNIKSRLLPAIYALNLDDPTLMFYDGLHKWISDSVDSLNRTGYSESILHRKFSVSSDRTSKSVINAIVQGSVAHCMQSVLINVASMYLDNILVEVHDSLTLMCRESMVNSIVNDIKQFVGFPLNGLVDGEYMFPFIVGVGKQYKRWDKSFRYDLSNLEYAFDCEQITSSAR